MTTALEREIDRRRTFAIISHPDAGKTTLTEKLLLHGGAIHVAGEVKAKRQRRAATSDWMKIEQERGISVATSVMQFEYAGHRFNLLDTPGHSDFSEDTYRTLSAADCAVMLVDIAKGVEPQTIKLFEVCRLRKIPIVTFVNKLDREGKPPLDVLDEIETVLGIPTSPFTWPVGQGKGFRGVYDRESARFLRYIPHGAARGETIEASLSDDDLADEIGVSPLDALREEIELLDDAGNEFDQEFFLAGEVTPVFFGSAMNNFGVEPFLRRLVTLCPPPLSRPTLTGRVDAREDRFTGFVFKIQANMDPRHRDRIAFVRVCSGRFERGMKVTHVRTSRTLTLDRSLNFFAQNRTMVEEAYSGDILGLWDPGVLRIGDSLCEGEAVQFEGIPIFSPEHFVRVVLKDPLRRKQLKKGLTQLSEEGAVQLFHSVDPNRVDPILGAVGLLQFEVVQERLRTEYSVEARFEALAYKQARWVFGKDGVKFDPKQIQGATSTECLLDIEDRPLVLFETRWARERTEERNPDLTFVAAVQPGRSKKAR